jgi:serine/threonine-protein kinase
MTRGTKRSSHVLRCSVGLSKTREVPAPTGSIIANRYEILRYIASGTYGEVYEVRDRHQDQVVALKVLDPTKLTGWPWDEAARLTALQSDYILRVWNADAVAGVPFVVTELATSTVLDLVQQIPWLLPATAVRYTRHACRGAARTHDEGILHRDIKPENLFVSVTGRVLLGDFGLAYPMDPNGEAPALGTPITKAPEVFAGAPTTVQSDVYSLGACLYRLLTGFYPYEDHAPADVPALAALVAGGPPTPVRDLAPHVSQGLAARVDRALDPVAANRYPTAAAMEADLGHLASPARHWQRVPPHPGHDACWESTNEAVCVRVCVTARTGSTQSDIETARITSGYRVLDNCKTGVARFALPGTLRAIFQRLGN